MLRSWVCGGVDRSVTGHAVKWGESGLAGRVGTKFRPLKKEIRLHG